MLFIVVGFVLLLSLVLMVLAGRCADEDGKVRCATTGRGRCLVLFGLLNLDWN